MTNNEEIDAAWAEMKRLAAQADAIYPGSGTELALRFVQGTIEGLRQLRGVVTQAANIEEFDEAFAEMKQLAARADATVPGSGTRGLCTDCRRASGRDPSQGGAGGSRGRARHAAATGSPMKTAVYLRQSLDRDGNQLAIDRQRDA